MLGKIQITVYKRERDVESIVNLLKRNRFYLGYLDPYLDVNKYLEYQERRGFQFAVVARADNKVVGHIALYLNGNQGVAQENEVYLSSAIIDTSYQRMMPSIGELYMLAMEEVMKRKYKVVICDTNKNNTASLYILRRLGGILLNAEPNMYNNYVVRIYTPIILETLGKKSIKEAVDEYGSFFEITHSLDKKKAKQQTELIEGKYVEQTYHLKEYLIEFFINIENQNMGKVYIRNYIQIELLQNDSILFIKSYQSLEIAISFYGKTNYVNTEQISLKEDGMYKIHILEKVKRIHIEFSVLTISLEIYPRPIQKEERMLICRQDKVFELDNGYLRFYKDGNPLFVEMWPCLTRPLLFGYLIPRKVNLKQEKIENNKYIVLEVKQAYIIHREYLFEPNKVKIHSYADIIEKTIIEPIFHIAFDNLKYKCSIITNNEIVNKKYDAINDRKYCNEEIIYEYFGKESYVENVMQEVLLTFENEEYRITTKENMYCFHQYNYIGFSFIKPSKILEKHIIKENVKVELGTIVIERRG